TRRNWTRGRGDKENRRKNDLELSVLSSPYHLVPLSPCPLVPLSILSPTPPSCILNTMTDLAVRCDSCGSFSRVPMLAVGMMAICPECRAEFVVRAATPQSEIPTVFPIHSPSEPSRGLLFGLALSAFLVPLAWLL